MVKTPWYSIINIAGLAAGLAFTMLVAAYIWNQWLVNRNLKNAENQYIIQSRWKDPNMGYNLSTLGPLAKALREKHPDLVANYYRYDGVTSFVSKGNKVFREGLQIGDSTLLNMYGFKLVYGDPKNVFAGPYSIVISREKAFKYFGRADVVGQTLSIENFSGGKHDFQITGVLDDISRNSVTHLADDFPNFIFLSVKDLDFFGRNMDWNNSAIAGYLELQQGIKPIDLEKPIQYLIIDNSSREVADNLTVYLVPLKKYFFSANDEMIRRMVRTLSIISGFILLMAAMNFVNITLSRSTGRLREIGMRKVLGSVRKHLIFQFLSESVLLVFFSTLFSLVLYEFLKSPMSRVLNYLLPSLYEFPAYFLLFPLLLVFMVGGLAGLYPALILSSLPAVDSLKNKLNHVNGHILVRKFLMAFQFCTAAVVITGAIIISQQVQLFFSHQLGYDKEFIVSAQVPRDWSPEGVRKMEYIRHHFAGLPPVKSVSLSYEVPDGNNSGNISIYREGQDSLSAVNAQLLMTDEYYAETYTIPMASGMYFQTPGIRPDSTKIVINETEARALGWSDVQQAVGQRVKIPGWPSTFKVAGVIKDFHFGSMQTAIQPLIILPLALTNTFRYFSFKIKPGNVKQTLDLLQNQWSVLLPGTSFEYKFLDDLLNKLYKTEIQLQRATYLAGGLSLFIALLGVLGLVSMSMHKRSREIGVRKILGASALNIIHLFVREFLPVIGLAGMVSIPLAWYMLYTWLKSYAYRIDLTVFPFIISFLGLVILTVLLVGIQTLKSSLENPVKKLKER